MLARAVCAGCRCNRTCINIQKRQTGRINMKYKEALIVVKDCNKAFQFYHDMSGLELIQDNDGTMELSGNIYLQEVSYLTSFTGNDVITRNNSSELYFEEPYIETFVSKLGELYRKQNM